jgi:integrase
VIPYFRGLKKDCITELSVTQFVKNVNENEKLSNAYKKKIIIIFKVALREILKDSVNSGQILMAVKTPRLDTPQVEVFTTAEQRLIEKEMLKSDDSRATGILLCFYTGIRLGELCALKWENINFETGVLSVVQTAARTRSFKGEKTISTLTESTPKSRNSVREIPIAGFLLGLLRGTKNSGEKYVFSCTDKPADPRTFQRLFKKILKTAGVKERKFHAIRHTFATRALETGVDVKTISEILGHSNAMITLKIYTHSLMEQKIAAIQKLNNIYVANIDIGQFAVVSAVKHL